MKLKFLLLASFGLLLLPRASAASTCSISATVCEGQAYVDTTTGGVASSRCFFLDTDSVAGDHACSATEDRPTWQVVAGSCLSLFYFDVTTGIAPPSAPNVVSLSVMYDNSATTIVTLLNAGAEPGNGASFSFCATSTGAVGGVARAGTYRILLHPVKNNGPGGVGNYDINSDGTAAVGAITQFAKGAMRGQMLVSSITASSPPAGSIFAYGSAGNENEVTTVTRTQANGQTGTTESVKVANQHLVGGSIVDSISGEISNAGTDTLSSTIDNKYDDAQVSYAGDFQITTNAALTALPWTIFPTSGHGAGVVFVSATEVREESIFTADPRIEFDSTGSHTFATADEIIVADDTIYNIGNTPVTSWFLFNARSELLSRSMTFSREDTATTTCQSFGSLTPTANKYSFTQTLTGVCLISHDSLGLPRFLRVTNTNQNELSNAVFTVSSLLTIDAHTQKTTVLCATTFPAAENCEDVSYIISLDVAHGWCNAQDVDGDAPIATGPNAVAWSFQDPTSTVVTSGTTRTAADGWTATTLNQGAVPPAGVWTFTCTIANDGNGNSGSNTQSINFISAFTADKICRLAITNGAGAQTFTVIANQTVRLYMHIEQSDAPVQPDTLPSLKVSDVPSISAPVWIDENQLVQPTMMNAVDNTATTNGALYWQDWTPSRPEVVSIGIDCQIQGAPLHFSQTVNVIGDKMNLTSLTFDTFFPVVICALIVAFLDRFPIWIIPGAVALGSLVMVQAFNQTGITVPIVFSAGGMVVGFAILQFYFRQVVRKNKKRSWFQDPNQGET